MTMLAGDTAAGNMDTVGHLNLCLLHFDFDKTIVNTGELYSNRYNDADIMLNNLTKPQLLPCSPLASHGCG